MISNSFSLVFFALLASVFAYPTSRLAMRQYDDNVEDYAENFDFNENYEPTFEYQSQYYSRPGDTEAGQYYYPDAYKDIQDESDYYDDYEQDYYNDRVPYYQASKGKPAPPKPAAPAPL